MTPIARAASLTAEYPLMSSKNSNVVYALDFDGVLCDSVTESSQTALRAAEKIWPHLRTSHPYSSHLLDALREIRPVIETGFENALLARLAIESSPDTINDDFVRPVLNDWPSIRDSVMSEWDVSKEHLVQVFGEARDEWIANDIDSWIASNHMYVRSVIVIYSVIRCIYSLSFNHTNDHKTFF